YRRFCRHRRRHPAGRRQYLQIPRRPGTGSGVHRAPREAVRLRQAPLERFLLMMWNYARFDFGNSYFRDVSVLRLIREKMPVSISLGLWMTLLSYAISIPLGIRKAVRDGTRFDTWTSAVIIVGYAIPGFLFAILLIILFAGGSFWDFFP